MTNLIPIEHIENKILLIRGQKVMLDRDLAVLYQLPVRTLNQAVTRNSDKFPEDFMFTLTAEEFDNLRSQIVISSWGGIRYVPRAFTEQGVAMLSSVLRSPRAVQVNIMIMRAFVKMRELIASHKDLAARLDELEKKYDKQFSIVFQAIRQLMEPEPPKKKGEFGFRN